MMWMLDVLKDALLPPQKQDEVVGYIPTGLSNRNIVVQVSLINSHIYSLILLQIIEKRCHEFFYLK